MTDQPAVVAIFTAREAREVRDALANEATCASARNELDRASRLRFQSDLMQRRLLAVEPVPYRAALAEVQIESPAVEAFVNEYRGQP